MENDEAQCNEFLALNSIFTEEAFQEHSLDGATDKKRRSGSLLIPVDHVKPIYVCWSKSSGGVYNKICFYSKCWLINHIE